MLSRIVVRALICIMWGLRPFLGPAECRFTMSCTRFAELMLQEYPLGPALYHIIKRVLSCNFLSRPPL